MPWRPFLVSNSAVQWGVIREFHFSVNRLWSRFRCPWAGNCLEASTMHRCLHDRLLERMAGSSSGRFVSAEAGPRPLEPPRNDCIAQVRFAGGA